LIPWCFEDDLTDGSDSFEDTFIEEEEDVDVSVSLTNVDLDDWDISYDCLVSPSNYEATLYVAPLAWWTPVQSIFQWWSYKAWCQIVVDDVLVRSNTLSFFVDCLGNSLDVSTPALAAFDSDDDGVCAHEDCNDMNPRMYPFAEEACGSIDLNCDGETSVCGLCDESLQDDSGCCPWEDFVCGSCWWQMSFYYMDADWDGEAWTLVESCLALDDYETESSDCDDNNNLIHDNHRELCDGIDNNCDGQIDLLFWASVCQELLCFYDGDGDGYRSMIPEMLTLDQWLWCPLWSSERQWNDCDDSDASVHPWANEACWTERNCDGEIRVCWISWPVIDIEIPLDSAVDEEDASDFAPLVDEESTREISCYEDSDGDAFLWRTARRFIVAETDSCPAWVEVSDFLSVLWDCDDKDETVYPWAVESCWKDSNCDGSFDACVGIDWNGNGIDEDDSENEQKDNTESIWDEEDNEDAQDEAICSCEDAWLCDSKYGKWCLTKKTCLNGRSFCWDVYESVCQKHETGICPQWYAAIGVPDGSGDLTRYCLKQQYCWEAWSFSHGTMRYANWLFGFDCRSDFVVPSDSSCWVDGLHSSAWDDDSSELPQEEALCGLSDGKTYDYFFDGSLDHMEYFCADEWANVQWFTKTALGWSWFCLVDDKKMTWCSAVQRLMCEMESFVVVTEQNSCENPVPYKSS